MKKALSILIIVLLTGAFPSGCMISHRSNESSDRSSGCAISRERLDRVEPGVTTKEWVIDNFGDPDREKHLQDGEDVMIYENTRHKSSHFSIFLIFNSHTSEDIKESVSFKIKDGIVKSYWID